MSDDVTSVVATPVAAPAAAPAVAPAAPAPGPTTIADAKAELFKSSSILPASLAEARAAMNAAAPDAPAPVATAVQPVVDALGRVHDAATGQFVSPATDEAPGTIADPATITAGDVPPDGFVRVDLPENHPFRDRGDTHWDVPKGIEDRVRWAVNNAIRLQEFEQTRSFADEISTYAETQYKEMQRLFAENAVLKQQVTGLFGQPDVLRQAEEIRQLQGEEAYNRYIAGMQYEQQQQVNAQLAEMQEQQANLQVEQQTNAFADHALTQARVAFPEASYGEVQQLMLDYAAQLDSQERISGRRPTLSVEEFLKGASFQLLQKNPHYRARVESYGNQLKQGEIDAAQKRAEVAAQQKLNEQLQAAAAARANNPLGRVAAGTFNTTTPVATDAGRPTTVHDARKALNYRVAR